MGFEEAPRSAEWRCLYKGCHFLFDTEELMLSHVKSEHGNIKARFECLNPRCKGILMTRKQLAKHMESCK
ncbi:hypothetical protein HDU97_007091 [Phlyctochytrium planicorne]|nr:hypothetical protein HDU97_007091 [Phlyctochytrium planicorne]